MADFEIRANNMTFRGIEEGPADGPIALLLHGFPDSHHTWRHLMGPLADAGYRAIAPAMRGYAPSDVPADGRYQTAALSLDAIALTEALGGDERAVLIGHDWGAIATYGAVAWSPGTWRKAVAMAVPPTTLPRTMVKRLTGDAKTPCRNPASRSSMMVIDPKMLANSIIIIITPG